MTRSTSKTFQYIGPALTMIILVLITINSPVNEFAQELHGSTECITTGLGPGNDATCGDLSSECETTGLGPGNDAACGGLATECVRTGLGPGNDVACGGRATECIRTGLGPDNDAACGGRDGRE